MKLIFNKIFIYFLINPLEIIFYRSIYRFKGNIYVFLYNLFTFFFKKREEYILKIIFTLLKVVKKIIFLIGSHIEKLDYFFIKTELIIGEILLLKIILLIKFILKKMTL